MMFLRLGSSLRWYIMHRKFQRWREFSSVVARCNSGERSIALFPPLDGSTLWFTPIHVLRGSQHKGAVFLRVAPYFIPSIQNRNNQREKWGEVPRKGGRMVVRGQRSRRKLLHLKDILALFPVFKSWSTSNQFSLDLKVGHTGFSGSKVVGMAVSIPVLPEHSWFWSVHHPWQVLMGGCQTCHGASPLYLNRLHHHILCAVGNSWCSDDHFSNLY